MRINSTSGAATTKGPSSTRRAGGGSSFTLGEQEAPRGPVGSTPLRTVSGIDGLIALQGIEDPTERRKRAVARGRKALDVLDNLKISMLDGTIDNGTLARLKVAREGLTEQTGDSGLDSVLDEINLRVEVELAKAGIR